MSTGINIASSSDLTVGTTTVTSGTDGRVLFQASGVVQQDAAFFWDNTNKRLGVGATPSTSVRLDVRAQGTLSTDIVFRVRNSADSTDILAIQGNNQVVKGASTIIVPNVQSVTSAATVTPVSGNDTVVITAQAEALTLANPTGTWVQGLPLMIRIKDNGTSRAITYGNKYRAIGVTLPPSTTATKTTYLGVIYNSTDDTFDVIGVTQES